MPLFLRLAVAAFITVCISFGATETPTLRSPNLQKARAQFRDFYLGASGEALAMRDSSGPPPDPKLGRQYARTLEADGHWSDLNYASQARSGWAPERHCSRMVAMTVSAEIPTASPEDRAALLDAIHRAFAYWISHDFQCPNWWYNEIGIPKWIGTIALLLGDDLTPDELRYAAGISLARFPIARTGQNKVWLAGNALMRGLLSGDEATLRTATDAIWSEVNVSSGSEGIQADFSFHQHGAQLQFGNYGMAFAVETARWCQIMRDTLWQLPPEKLEIFRRYLLDGQSWIAWRGVMDISSCGRQLTPHSPRSKVVNIAGVMKQAETFDPKRRESYVAYVERNHPGAVNDLVGEQFFWRSDYVVHRRPELAITLKMSSLRVIGTELVNSENLSGYHLADGATYFYRTGNEYEDIFPVWDWSKLPGVTCAQTPPPSYKTSSVPRDFVGGVTDGASGAYALGYVRDGVQAKKAWFFSGDVVICLGADISASAAAPIATTVNQCLHHGPVRIYHGTTIQTLASGMHEVPADVSAIDHDGWRTTLLERGGVHVAIGPVTGNWHRVFDNPESPSADVTKDVFTLWIDHGAGPRAAHYAYAMSPSATAGTAFLGKVIENSGSRQIVQFPDGKTALIFWASGEATLPNGRILKVDTPCVVLVSESTVRVAEPTQKLSTLELTIAGRSHTVSLPRGAQAGTAVEVKLDQSGARSM